MPNRLSVESIRWNGEVKKFIIMHYAFRCENHKSFLDTDASVKVVIRGKIFV